MCGGADRLRTSGDGLTAESEGYSIVERTNDEVAKLVARASVPSSNFLPLSYQICGRLGTAPVAGNAFPDVLRKLVDACAPSTPTTCCTTCRRCGAATGWAGAARPSCTRRRARRSTRRATASTRSPGIPAPRRDGSRDGRG